MNVCVREKQRQRQRARIPGASGNKYVDEFLSLCFHVSDKLTIPTYQEHWKDQTKLVQNAFYTIDYPTTSDRTLVDTVLNKNTNMLAQTCDSRYL